MDTPDASAESELQSERVRVAFEQIPVATFVTVINALIMVAVLVPHQPQGIVVWFGCAVAVSAGRIATWQAYRRAAAAAAQPRGWSAVCVAGALATGLLWGVGAVVLFPPVEAYQLFWAILIAGMCAGASALHYAHLPSTVAFIVPAAAPLAVRFALEPTGRAMAVSGLTMVFAAALVMTARRSSRNFGESVRLRLDLAHRTRELDASNRRLREEMNERRNAEASLRHAQKMEAVGQLTGGIAHDFNNLLTAVLASLALLRKHLPPDDARALRLLENANRGAERGAVLTQRLLAFGRRQTLKPELVRLQVLVPGMFGLLRSSAGSRVQIAIDLPEHLPPVLADANQLELALLNLVLNARDAMPEGGEVAISAREEAGQAEARRVVLRVADTGAGMDEETLARATEPFFTTKGVGKGTGLGLAMVHGFAAQSGGQLVLQSRPGRGTVAELWLPRAEPVGPVAGADPDAAPKRAPEQATRGLRVLVVDDDPLVLASTVSMLEDLGHAAEAVASGEEALDLVGRDGRFDLVVADYAMPGMNGLQLAEALNRLRPELPLLIATGYAELPGRQAGGLVLLAKPFRQEALAEAMAECLGRAGSA